MIAHCPCANKVRSKRVTSLTFPALSEICRPASPPTLRRCSLLQGWCALGASSWPSINYCEQVKFRVNKHHARSLGCTCHFPALLSRAKKGEDVHLIVDEFAQRDPDSTTYVCIQISFWGRTKLPISHHRRSIEPPFLNVPKQCSNTSELHLHFHL